LAIYRNDSLCLQGPRSRGNDWEYVVLHFPANSLKRLAQIWISAKNEGSLSIVAGPLKGRRLPRSIAARSVGMLVGRYESGVVRKILSLAGSIKVAYDVGSNVGYVALALCHCAKAEEVFAFEPVPSNLDLIRDIAAENHLTSHMIPVPKALSDENGTQMMYSWWDSSMFFLESARDDQNVAPTQAFPVETCTMDSFIFDGSNKPPDFIKIDVEGAEDLVIKGAMRTLQTFNPRLLIEVHGPKNAEKIWASLSPLGYQAWHIKANGKEERVRQDDLAGLCTRDSWTAHLFLSRKTP
jgi:FkbM family methyltransferase